MKFLNKILKNQRFKMITILFFLLILYTFFCAFSYAQNVSSDLANSVFRLHVIANSDSKEDQDLKYKVRDNLIEYMNNISENCNSKEEVINLAQEHLNDFKKIAEDTTQATIEITISNAKNENVQIEYEQNFGWVDWKIISEELKSRRKDASTAQWLIDIPAQSKYVFTYTVRLSKKD